MHILSAQIWWINTIVWGSFTPISLKQELLWPHVSCFLPISFFLSLLALLNVMNLQFAKFNECMSSYQSVGWDTASRYSKHCMCGASWVQCPALNKNKARQCPGVIWLTMISWNTLSWPPRLHLFMIGRYLVGHLPPSFPLLGAYSWHLSGMGTRFYFAHSTYFPKII